VLFFAFVSSSLPTLLCSHERRCFLCPDAVNILPKKWTTTAGKQIASPEQGAIIDPD